MNRKDFFLYGIGILLFAFISIILILTQEKLYCSILDSNNTKYALPQLEQTKIRYEYSSKILLANITRKNIAFLIGTMMTILGTILIISKIESNINAGIDTFEKAKFQITTTSPGVFVVLLGSIMIMLTILKTDTYNFHDEPITTKQSQEGSTPETEEFYDVNDTTTLEDIIVLPK